MGLIVFNPPRTPPEHWITHASNHVPTAPPPGSSPLRPPPRAAGRRARDRPRGDRLPAGPDHRGRRPRHARGRLDRADRRRHDRRGRRPRHGPLGRARPPRPHHLVVALHALRHGDDVPEALRHRRRGRHRAACSRPSCPTSATTASPSPSPCAPTRSSPTAPRSTPSAVVTTIERDLRKRTRRGAASSARSRPSPPSTTRTVEVTYSEPFAPLTAALADRAGMIMSPTALAAAGDTFGDAPSASARTSSSSACRRPRSPSSATRATTTPSQAHFDTITYRIITDASIRAANLQSGDVQVADTMSTQDVDTLRDDDSLTVLEVGSLGYQGLTVNIGNQDGVGTDPCRSTRRSRATPRSARRSRCRSTASALVDTVFGGCTTRPARRSRRAARTRPTPATPAPRRPGRGGEADARARPASRRRSPSTCR